MPDLIVSLIGNPAGNECLVETWISHPDVSFMIGCTATEALASLSRIVIVDNPTPEDAIRLDKTGIADIFEVYDANARAVDWQPLVAKKPYMRAIGLAKVALDIMQTPDGKPDDEAKAAFNETLEAAATDRGIELNLIATS